MAPFAFDPEQEGEVVAEKRRKTKRPRRWRVLLHNDDFTAMDFVVHVLMKHFHKSPPEATFIMAPRSPFGASPPAAFSVMHPAHACASSGGGCNFERALFDQRETYNASRPMPQWGGQR
jgi:hypothetical protein